MVLKNKQNKEFAEIICDLQSLKYLLSGSLEKSFADS